MIQIDDIIVVFFPLIGGFKKPPRFCFCLVFVHHGDLLGGLGSMEMDITLRLVDRKAVKESSSGGHRVQLDWTKDLLRKFGPAVDLI